MPPIFSLEAVYAGKGDALILHHGTTANPRWILIDGGHRDVYSQWLRPRLDELRLTNTNSLTSDGKLPLDMVMVSHADEDHLYGLLELKADMQAPDTGLNQAPVDIKQMWINGFDDLAFPDLATATEPQSEIFDQVVATAVGNAPTPLLNDHTIRNHDVAAVVASTRQGRELREFAKTQHIPINKQFNGDLIRRDATSEAGRRLSIASGLHMTVLGPDQERITKLRNKWKTDLKKILDKERATPAAFSDDSPHNLASVMVLVERHDKTMLLTGDGRGDHLVEGLSQQGVLAPHEQTVHVDLFKIPHHGSSRNVTSKTFETITATHYVISGNGEHHNPDPEMLTMLAQGRRTTRGDQDEYFLHLTIPDRAFEAISDETAEKPNRRKQRDALIAIDDWMTNDRPTNLTPVFRRRSHPSVLIDLLQSIPGRP